MLHHAAAGWAWVAMLSLSASPAPLPEHGANRSATAQTQLIEIPRPGRTGLTAGRYRLALERVAESRDEIRVILSLAPSGRSHRYAGRVTGCDPAEIGTTRWQERLTGNDDGSLRLVLVSTSRPGCRIVAAIPAVPVPGIEGSPIGTAGAPSQKAPGIEGSPIGTAGAPKQPGLGRANASSADREFQLLIEKARQALPRLACQGAAADAQAQVAPVRSALERVSVSKTPAAAMQPLRRFDAARAAIEEVLLQDRGFAAAARACVDAQRTCAASGSVGKGCGIDEAVCLARVRCGAD